MTDDADVQADVMARPPTDEGPVAVVRAIASRVEGATFHADGVWAEARLPDGIRISAQDGALLMSCSVSTDLFLRVGASDEVANVAVATIAGSDVFAPLDYADRAARFCVDEPWAGLLELLVRPGDRLSITNSDATLVTTASGIDLDLTRMTALHDLAQHLESAWPRQMSTPWIAPAGLADLTSLVHRWAVGDDGRRSDLIGAADDDDLRILLETVRLRDGDIEQALATDDGDLLWLLEAAAEARGELDSRAREAASNADL